MKWTILLAAMISMSGCIPAPARIQDKPEIVGRVQTSTDERAVQAVRYYRCIPNAYPDCDGTLISRSEVDEHGRFQIDGERKTRLFIPLAPFSCFKRFGLQMEVESGSDSNIWMFVTSPRCDVPTPIHVSCSINDHKELNCDASEI